MAKHTPAGSEFNPFWVDVDLHVRREFLGCWHETQNMGTSEIHLIAAEVAD